MKGKIVCVVVRENYQGKSILYVPLLGGVSRVSQDTRTRHGPCYRALVRHDSHLSRNRLNLVPWFCYWLASALSSLTCLVLKTGTTRAGLASWWAEMQFPMRGQKTA